MAAALFPKAHVNESFASDPNLMENTRQLFLDSNSDDSSLYRSYAATVSSHNVGSEKLGEIDEDNTYHHKEREKQSNSVQNLKQSSALAEQNVTDCQIPKNLLLKLKSYIFIQSQKEEEFSIDDLQREFNDKFEAPDGVEIEYELQRLGIVVVKYSHYKMKMIPKPKFISDYAREKLNDKVST